MIRGAIDTPATERALGLKMRPDLELRPQNFGRSRVWAVKDPISLRYFHLREEEHAVLRMLNGQTTLEDIRRQCGEMFAPRSLTLQQVQAFLSTLHGNGLLLADASGQGGQLLLRRGGQQRRRRIEALSNLLSIRFRGINPGGLLDVLDPKFRWLFSPACVVMSLLFAIAALLLVAVEYDVLRARLIDFEAVMAASNLPWLLLCLVVTKILHELGHALACRRFGGDCPEIGVMLLAFVPCLYCNVSDSWMLPSRWQRIAIAAAGMYIELILATLGTFLWWFSEPGLFNSLCLNVVLICSVGTLFFNGNPLLRYDGYYILSDWVGVPNLGTQATAAARRRLAGLCLGVVLPKDPMAPARGEGWLVLYAVASSIYRCVVVVAIFWALRQILRPYQLESLLIVPAMTVLITMVWPVASTAMRLAREPARRRPIAPARAALSVLILLGVLGIAIWMPLPMRVTAPVVLEPRDAERVYVTVPGAITAIAHEGERVVKDQVLAQLASATIPLEVAKLTSQRDRQELYLANLEAQKLQGVIDGAQIPTARAALADLSQRLDQLRRDAGRLALRAPVDGTVLPPPNRPRPTGTRDKLEAWSGTPLDPQNLGTYLETGTLVCLVGDPDRFEAVLHVEQSDIELVQIGQRVRIVLDELPGRTLWGQVAEIARLDLESMPRELAAARDLPSRTDQRGVARPLDTWYQARVFFDDAPPHLMARSHGRAQIAVAAQSLGSQLARYLKQTFSR